ncbi:hypothetical protein ACXYX3_17900 [Mycobacterium sp. C3-094]
MSAPSIGEDLFTTEQRDDRLWFKVDGNTVAIASPLNMDVPGFYKAWQVSLFDPFGGDASAIASDEEGARELAELFARTAARAVNR